jgi:magnesium transporter
LDTFIGPNYLVTIHQGHLPELVQVRRRWEQMRLPRESTAYLFYLISDVVVDDYFPVVDEIGDRIDDLDKRLFESMEPSSLQEIFVLRKSLLSIRKIIAPLRDAFNELIRSEEGGTIFPIVQTRAYFNDVYDHILRLLDFVDTNRDMLSGSLDAYQSSQSNRLNENMQRLTVIATVLATATVVTGYFGMNLHGTGINSSWAYGGHVVLVVVLVLAVLEIWLFRRKGWL